MKPPLACKNCRARKKKCDRAYPICSYCLRTHDRCEYRIDGHTSYSVRPVVAATPRENENESSQRLRLNAAMFLGGPNQIIPAAPSLRSAAVGADVLEYIAGPDQGQRQQWISNFINVIDPWIPFVSINELRKLSSIQSSLLNAEDVLLLACIKLNADTLPEDQPLNKYYLAVKSAFTTMKIYGTLSIRFLQATILLLFYEHGHGIYPSAYATLGSCARYLGALRTEAALEEKDTTDWMYLEQRRRLWWSIYVMERIIALGCPQHPLLLREPNEGHILPSDDISWRQEHPSANSSLTLLSPASSNMGTFRLLVHAAYLVGRVIQLISDFNSGDQSVSTRRAQLYRTISALATLLEVEQQTSIVSVSVARSTINSALFVLYSFDIPDDNGLGTIYDPHHPLSESAHTCLHLTRLYVSGQSASSLRASPFLLSWAYPTFKHFYDRYNLDGHPESLEALEIMRQGWESLGKKWKLAGVYAVLLNVNQASN